VSDPVEASAVGPARAALARWRERYPARYEHLRHLPTPLALVEVADDLSLRARSASREEVLSRLLAGEPFAHLR
jgi:hypothetical protein